MTLFSSQLLPAQLPAIRDDVENAIKSLCLATVIVLFALRSWQPFPVHARQSRVALSDENNEHLFVSLIYLPSTHVPTSAHPIDLHKAFTEQKRF